MSGKKNDNWLIFQTVFFVLLFSSLLGWKKFWALMGKVFSKTWEPIWNYFGRDIVIAYSIYFGIVILMFFFGILLTKKTKKKIYFYISGILNVIGLIGFYLIYR